MADTAKPENKSSSLDVHCVLCTFLAIQYTFSKSVRNSGIFNLTISHNPNLIIIWQVLRQSVTVPKSLYLLKTIAIPVIFAHLYKRYLQIEVIIDLHL